MVAAHNVKVYDFNDPRDLEQFALDRTIDYIVFRIDYEERQGGRP